MARLNKRVNRFSHHFRPIIPDRRPPPLTVHHITVTHIGTTSIIKIYPSQACIKAKDLIAMIANQQDHLVTGNGEWIQSREILAATGGLLETPVPQISDSTNNSGCPAEHKEKRVMNAFMLYRKAHAKKLHSLFPEYTATDISKFLAASWRMVPKDVKEKYHREWRDSRDEQIERHPDYNHNSWKKVKQQQQMPEEKSYIDPAALDPWYNFDLDFLLDNSSSSVLPANGSNVSDQGSSMSSLDGLTARLNVASQATTSSDSLDLSGYLPAAANPSSSIEDWQAFCNLLSTPWPEAVILNDLVLPEVDNSSFTAPFSDYSSSTTNILPSFAEFPDLFVANPQYLDSCDSSNVHLPTQ